MASLRTGAEAAAGVLVLALTLSGCDGRASRPSPSPVSVRWQAVPDVAPGLAVSELVSCGDFWYAVGGTRTGPDTTTPGLFRSADGASWQPLRVEPVSVYGPQNLLYSAGCAGGRLVALGTTAGGVHANPRTSSWVAMLPDGSLREVPAGFELFGGNAAIGVNTVAAGTRGFVLAGNRIGANGRAGAVVWRSPDGSQFALVDGDPALSSDADAMTEASAAVALADGTWLLGGALQRHNSPGAAREPLAWRSTDGAAWQREVLPDASGDTAVERIAGWSDGALAVGVRQGRFASWLRGRAGGWQPARAFGSASGTEVPRVAGLAVSEGRAVAVVCDGTSYRLWLTTEGIGWRPVPAPAELSCGRQHHLTVALRGGELLAGVDDGTQARLLHAAVG
ncbi:hypothetical protein ABT297_04970 [Dactylosporangium sp. NPDC000555]|uniref:hypothetical protein n=1 Tax=Dactylosporangium sp. NPDC000555 TaxID=3154260 RepID=UPI00333090B0